MKLLKEIAAFLTDCGVRTTVGYLPQAPDRAACLYAGEWRPERDAEGLRLQLVFRGERQGNEGLEDAVFALRLLDGFEGRLTPEGANIVRVKLESGPSSMGADRNNRAEYSMNLRIWYTE